jgi:hypothetical protein
MSQTKAQIDKLLTEVSNGLFPKGYIADKLFPTLSVKQKSGLIGAYGNSHLRAVDDLIGGQAKAQFVEPIDYKLTEQYQIFSHALGGIVTPDDYDNVEKPFDAEADQTSGLTHMILTNKEKSVADSLFNPAIITQNGLSGTKFDVYASSDPLSNFRTAQNTVLDGCGVAPNAVVMSKKVFNTLIYHPQILDILGFKYNQVGLLSIEDMKRALNVEELLIADAPYISSKEGQTDVLSQIWGNSVLFYVKPASAGKYQMSLGYHMTLSSRAGRAVYKTAIDNPPNATQIIVEDSYSFKLVNTKCAFLIPSVLT